MENKVTFRPGSRDDDAQLVLLLNETFRTPITGQHWDWFLYDNPNGLNRVYVMQNPEGTPVGCYCVSPLVIQFDARPRHCGFAHHLVVHPDYRDAHNFIGFSRYVFESESRLGTDFLIGPPNKNSYQAHKVLAGWSDLTFLDCLYKPKPQSQSHSCREVGIFDNDYQELLQTISRGHSIYLEKSVSWLNWRYLDCPDNPYTSFAFYQSGKLQGFIVLKHWQDPDGYRKAHIMDLWAVTDQAVSQLLAAAEQYAAGCDELNLWCVESYPYREKLAASGFVPRESARQPVIARPLAGKLPALAEGCWSFMYGDADGY